ncbi:hypothetical protein [Ferrimonas balearica]|uniref:hypothetical protein n=1 Tax=Ferrimonas balearica TaxID=44012 RepID=UPI001C97053D|nr:hypothetical protein [Ferrimonas balearica]MBY5981236.1 hypothetical protein [Ferrimonas balearica]
MSDDNNQSDADKSKEQAEAERIAKWRAERAAVAEQQKQERIKQRQEQREAEQAAKAQEVAQTAEALIPSASDLRASRNHYLQRRAQQKRKMQKQFLYIVLIPALLVLFYQSFIATPLYSARSVISVSSKQGEDNVSALGGLTGLGGQSSRVDVHSALAFLQSKEILDILEAEQGTLTRLASGEVDPVFRLRDLPLFMSSVTTRAGGFIRSSMDIQSGLITLDVRDVEPQIAVQTSDRLIGLVSDKIDALSDELFANRLESANLTVELARQEVFSARERMTQLQLESGLQDPVEYIASVYRTISEMEAELLKLQNEIQKFAVSGTGNPLTRNLIKQEAELKARIEAERTSLLKDNGSGGMALFIRRYNQAELEVEIASEILSKALQAQSEAEKEASLGRSMVQVVVMPQVDSVPSHPNLFKSLFLTLTVFYILFLAVRLLWRDQSNP